MVSFQIREESKYQILNTEELQPDVDDSQLECTDQQVEAVEQSEKPTLSSESDKPRKFKQFDVVNECFDHHFINESGNENVACILEIFLTLNSTVFSYHTSFV